MIVSAEDITHAYTSLDNATNRVLQTQLYALGLKYELDDAISRAIAHGEIEGKNDSERKANTDTKFSERKTQLRIAQGEAEIANVDFELAQHEVSRVQALLRLLEVTSKLPGD